MSESMEHTCQAPGLSREDIIEAMKAIPGYLDISVDDFALVYRAAYEHARRRMRRSVTAADIMTREVAVATGVTPLVMAAAEMARMGASGLPVVDGERRVIGVISESDILKALRPGEHGGFMSLVAACLAKPDCLAAPLRKQNVQSLMSTPAVTIGPDDDAEAMAELMAREKVNRLPVVDAEGRLVGLVTRGDLMAALSEGGRP